MTIQMIIQEKIQQIAALTALKYVEELYRKQKKNHGQKRNDGQKRNKGQKRKRDEHDEIKFYNDDNDDEANSTVNYLLPKYYLTKIDIRDLKKEFGSKILNIVFSKLINDTNDTNDKNDKLLLHLLKYYLINQSVDNLNIINEKIILFSDTSQNINQSIITKKFIIDKLEKLINNEELQLTYNQFNSIKMISYDNTELNELYSEIEFYNNYNNYNINEKSLKIILNIINKYLSLIKLEISPANLIDSTQLKCIPKENFFKFLRKYNLKCIMSNCLDDANTDTKDIKQESFYSEHFVLINWNGKKVFSNAENKLNCIFPGIEFTITFGVFDSDVYPILYLKFDYNDNNDNDNEEYQDVIIKHKNLENKYKYLPSLLLETLNKPNISNILDGLLNCSKCKITDYKKMLKTLKTELDIEQELEYDEMSDKKNVTKKEIQFKIAVYDLIKCIILWNNKTNKLSYEELFLDVIKLLFILKLIGDQCQVDLIKNIIENPEFDKNNIVMFQTNDKILLEYSIKEGLNTIDNNHNILMKK